MPCAHISRHAAALQFCTNADEPRREREAARPGGLDELGPAQALADIASLEPTSPLVDLVISSYDDVRRLIGAGAAR